MRLAISPRPIPGSRQEAKAAMAVPGPQGQIQDRRRKWRGKKIRQRVRHLFQVKCEALPAGRSRRLPPPAEGDGLPVLFTALVLLLAFAHAL